MAFGLELHRVLQRAEAVQVLDLDLGAEAGRAHRSEADVALDPHRAGLHVAVRGADVPQDVAQRLPYARAWAGERMSGSVTISISGTPARLKSTRLYRRPPCCRRAVSSSRCARVIPMLTSPLRRHRHAQATVRAQRQRVLADLVALRQVRVEVVLALEAHRLGLDVAVERDPGADHELHGAAVDDRQGAGHPQADGADARIRLVRFRAGRCRAAAEHLRLGAQLGVHLDADDRS